MVCFRLNGSEELKSIIIVFLCVLIVTGFLGCSDEVPAIEVRLSFAESPVLNKPVKITASFNIRPGIFKEGLQDVKGQFQLSEGFQLVDGSPEWYGYLPNNQTLTMEATIKAVKIGTYIIGAHVATQSGGSVWGDSFLYVTITEKNVVVSREKPIDLTTKTPAQTNPPSGYPTPSIPPVKPIE
jgi:hypothetical protein